MVRARDCGHALCQWTIRRASNALAMERMQEIQSEPMGTLVTSDGPVMIPLRLVKSTMALFEAIPCSKQNHDPGDEDRSQR